MKKIIPFIKSFFRNGLVSDELLLLFFIAVLSALGALQFSALREYAIATLLFLGGTLFFALMIMFARIIFTSKQYKNTKPK